MVYMGDTATGTSAPSVSQEIIHRHHRFTPIGFYSLVEKLVRMAYSENFIDAILSTAAFLSFAIAFNFYPPVLIIIIAVLIFAAALYHPLIGLVLFIILIIPIFMYHSPPIGWMLLFAAAIAMLLGYMHYRMITFMYILVGLAFSPLGLLLEIPALIMVLLIVGYKRAAITVAVAILVIVSFSSVLNVANYGYIVYNSTAEHSIISGATILQFNVQNTTTPSFTQFFSSTLPNSLSAFSSQQVIENMGEAFPILLVPLFAQPIYLVEILGFVIIGFFMDGVASSSRSRYKGTKASILGIGYPMVYIGLASVSGASFLILAPIISFFVAPLVLFTLEANRVTVVKTLDVRKRDIRMRFGEAFEELAAGSTTDTFDKIGNYESTKKELMQSVLAPIEDKAISTAYKVKPTKGILFFGPPGTGKTMMMRALANEIHGGFFQVKSSNLISMYPGETEKRISEIFSIAKKNAPCVLFFDEIDSLARKRDDPSMDSTHKSALTQLLIEMDGFQRFNNVIVVGATNVPNLLDTAVMRPGRLDKIIYMPLPDKKGREKIIKLYLSGLPMAKDINVQKLVEITERYSGADIKAAIDNVAQKVASEAASEHKILEISQADLVTTFRGTKPSTTLMQLEMYSKFKLDFERRSFSDRIEETKDDITTMGSVIGLDDVKEAIHDAVEIPLMRPDLMAKYNVKPISGILMFGPPGNGKTLLMRAVRHELNDVTMFELSGPDLLASGTDKATETIKELFNKARENQPSIIFIDEIEGIIPNRAEASELSTQITVEMLTQLDGMKKLSGVVIIAATNSPERLDPAILRPGRFDKIIFVRPPNKTERIAMMRDNFKDIPISENMDFDKLSDLTEGFTGADMAHIARELKTSAINKEMSTGKEGKISQEEVEKVITSIKPSAPKALVDSYLDFLQKYGER
jgi:SpoVK/Ycf46/Vps4 family AAA+-type ATPase